jgi:hypothetical protein
VSPNARSCAGRPSISPGRRAGEPLPVRRRPPRHLRGCCGRVSWSRSAARRFCLAERNPGTSAAGRQRCAAHRADPCCSRLRQHLRAPRITAELTDGVPTDGRVNHKRAARVMREHGIAGYRRLRRVRTTIPEPSDQNVPDLLKRDFTAQGAESSLRRRHHLFAPVPWGEHVSGHGDRLILPPSRWLGDRRPEAHRAGRRRAHRGPRDPRESGRGDLPLRPRCLHLDRLRASAPTSGSFSRWVRSGPAPTTASPKRSTRP